MRRRRKQSLDHPELVLPEMRSLWKTVGLFSDHYLKNITAYGFRLKDSDEDKIRDRFQKAKTKIIPLESVLTFTDRLIDQIVYRLYGLTDEEIKIVEEPKKSNSLGRLRKRRPGARKDRGQT